MSWAKDGQLSAKGQDGGNLLWRHESTSQMPSGYSHSAYRRISQTSVTYISPRHIDIRYLLGFPHSSDSRESACNAGDPGSLPWVGKIPWRREQEPTPVFLSEESHGLKSLTGHSPWGCKELDTTEQLTHTQTHTHSGIMQFEVGININRCKLLCLEQISNRVPQYSKGKNLLG